MGAAWACGEKVWKTFMSIDISRNYDAKVREDLNRPRARFCCLKQDVQDAQDLQDGAAWACGEKVWKTLMSIDTQQETR